MPISSNVNVWQKEIIKKPNNLQALGASIELFVVFTQLLLLYLLRNLLRFLLLYLLVRQLK